MSSSFKDPELINDPYYDADFSIDISKKMTVPNKIQAVEGTYPEMLNDPAILAIQGENIELMRVPDCIRVAGNETHIATREPPPEMKLEDQLFGKPNDRPPIQLSTPPRTLRYEDAVPIFAEPIKQLDIALNSSRISNRTMDGSMLMMKMNNDNTLIEYDDPELVPQNFLKLRRRILELSHRIDSLEIENRHRNKRDLIIYVIGALYFLFRGLSWFANRNRFAF